MTKEVVSVYPDTPLTDASYILVNKKLNGLPVLKDPKDKKIVGIITEYDLIMKGTRIHLPTFLKIMQNVDLYKKDASPIKKDLQAILALKVKEAMNDDPLTLKDTATIEETAAAFAEHHRVNPILVVNGAGELAGVVSRCDLIKFFAGVGPDTDSGLAEGAAGASRSVDKRMNQFLRSFDKDFVVVSKFRTHYWLIISALFLIVGFIIAFALIIQISIR